MAERHILYKLLPFIQGNKIANAEDVEFDNTDRTGIGNGVTDIQTFLDRVDETGLGKAVFSFSGNYEAVNANVDEWLNRELVGADGQTNARRTFTLPGGTAVTAALQQLTDVGLPSVLRITITYFGGDSTQVSTNALVISPRVGGPQFAGTRTSITLSRGQQTTVEITSSSGSWTVVSMPSMVTTPGTGDVLGDIELRSETWDASSTGVLPSTVLQGYAYFVTNAPSDGSGRFGVRMQTGDLVVWSAASFTAWTDTNNWFVLSEADGKHISAAESNFLLQVTESDIQVDGDRIVDNGATRALVWLSPAEFATAPFISPDGDSNNPRPGQTIEYVGGEDDQNANGDFELDENFFDAILYVGIDPNDFTDTEPASTIFVVVTNIDGTEHARYNLATDFQSVLGNSTFDHFLFTGGDAGAREFHYANNQTIKIIQEQTQRRYTLNSLTVNVTDNISNLPESRLDAITRAKINKQIQLDHDDRIKLDNITETTTVATGQDIEGFLAKTGGPSSELTDYHTFDDLPPSFSGSVTYTVLINDNEEITSIVPAGGGSATFTEIAPSLFSGKRTYTIVVTGGTDIFGIVGSVTTIASLVPTNLYQVGFDALAPAVVAAIGAESSLPETLQAIAQHSSIETAGGDDFLSVHPHAGIRSFFTVLKNEPQLGDPVPITGDLFINEITPSDITVTPPTDLNTVLIPRDESGTFVDGVASVTNGALTGPGINGASFDMTYANDTNFRLVLGIWFYIKNSITGRENLLEIKERGVSTYRNIIGVRNNRLVYFRSNEDGSSSNVTIQHRLHHEDGGIYGQFTSNGQTHRYRVYEARTYTVQAIVRDSSGNLLEGLSDTYTITDINTSQAATNITFPFSGGGLASQTISVAYNAATIPHVGPAHELVVTLPTLDTSGGAARLDVRFEYPETVAVRTGNTYTNLLQSDGDVRTNRLHKIITSFRATVPGNQLEQIFSFYGYDSNNAPRVFDENTETLNYNPNNLDWSSIRIGQDSSNLVIQNVQGFFLNPDTPLVQYPLHSDLRTWESSHDNKSLDYVWDFAVEEQGIEEIVINEGINLPNLILTSPDGTDYKITVENGGTLKTEEII